MTYSWIRPPLYIQTTYSCPVKIKQFRIQLTNLSNKRVIRCTPEKWSQAIEVCQTWAQKQHDPKKTLFTVQIKFDWIESVQFCSEKPQQTIIPSFEQIESFCHESINQHWTFHAISSWNEKWFQWNSTNCKLETIKPFYVNEMVFIKQK